MANGRNTARLLSAFGGASSFLPVHELWLWPRTKYLEARRVTQTSSGGTSSHTAIRIVGSFCAHEMDSFHPIAHISCFVPRLSHGSGPAPMIIMPHREPCRRFLRRLLSFSRRHVDSCEPRVHDNDADSPAAGMSLGVLFCREHLHEHRATWRSCLPGSHNEVL